LEFIGYFPSKRTLTFLKNNVASEILNCSVLAYPLLYSKKKINPYSTKKAKKTATLFKNEVAVCAIFNRSVLNRPGERENAARASRALSLGK